MVEIYVQLIPKTYIKQFKLHIERDIRSIAFEVLLKIFLNDWVIDDFIEFYKLINVLNTEIRDGGVFGVFLTNNMHIIQAVVEIMADTKFIFFYNFIFSI